VAEAEEYAEYMRRAKFCVDFAATVTDAGYRDELLKMAEKWRQLAQEAQGRKEGT
jgi:hypothetical protein